MKYIITGSIGHISRPIVQNLLTAGHQVTVITSSAAREQEIKALGAEAAVGSVEDREFLTRAFAGADSAYLMIPPKWIVANWFDYLKGVADNYLAAVQAHNIRHIVILSSVGGHMRKGCGPVDGTAYLEEASASLTDTHVRILRPSYFYYNLFNQIDMIKHAGFIGSTQPADFKLVLTDTSDIADAALALLLDLSFTGYGVEYIASDDRHTWADITKALGEAIGKPGLPYVELTDEQSRVGMLQAGINPVIADGYVEMGQALRSGEMQAHYWANLPKTYGKIKLEDFTKEFAAAYHAG
jgi:uncharacterized protein YbjT (DUF2867 family)